MGKHTVIFLSAFTMILISATGAKAGNVSLTTYYPAPSGYYNKVTVSDNLKIKSFDPNDPSLACAGTVGTDKYNILFVDNAVTPPVLKMKVCNGSTEEATYAMGGWDRVDATDPAKGYQTTLPVGIGGPSDSTIPLKVTGNVVTTGDVSATNMNPSGDVTAGGDVTAIGVVTGGGIKLPTSSGAPASCNTDGCLWIEP